MDINCFSVFLGQSTETTEIKAKINKCDLIKLPCFGIAKEIIKKTYRMGENTCKWYDPQGLKLQNIQTAHTTQQQKKSNNPIKKCTENLKKTFLQRHTDGQ